jgi:hypothetical protein
MIYTIKKLAIAAPLCAFLLVFSACKKETDDYNLTVLVRVNDSTRVQNALVRVYAPVKGSFLDYYQYTDENGETTFTINRKAVVEIVASKGSYKGCSFKELFNGGNNVTLDIKAFGNNENGCQ